MVKLGVLEKDNDSPWASPAFIIPKKNGMVRFLTNLCKENAKIEQKLFLIPKIIEVMQKLERF